MPNIRVISWNLYPRLAASVPTFNIVQRASLRSSEGYRHSTVDCSLVFRAREAREWHTYISLAENDPIASATPSANSGIIHRASPRSCEGHRHFVINCSFAVRVREARKWHTYMSLAENDPYTLGKEHHISPSASVGTFISMHRASHGLGEHPGQSHNGRHLVVDMCQAWERQMKVSLAENSLNHSHC